VEVPGHPTVFLQDIVLPNSVGAVATMEPVTVVLREVDQRSGVLF